MLRLSSLSATKPQLCCRRSGIRRSIECKASHRWVFYRFHPRPVSVLAWPSLAHCQISLELHGSAFSSSNHYTIAWSFLCSRVIGRWPVDLPILQTAQSCGHSLSLYSNLQVSLKVRFVEHIGDNWTAILFFLAVNGLIPSGWRYLRNTVEKAFQKVKRWWNGWIMRK